MIPWGAECTNVARLRGRDDVAAPAREPTEAEKRAARLIRPPPTFGTLAHYDSVLVEAMPVCVDREIVTQELVWFWMLRRRPLPWWQRARWIASLCWALWRGKKRRRP